MKLFCSLLIASATIIASCADKSSPQETQNPRIDGFTRATPGGGEFRPAERGPVRDVFEPPPVNLERFQLIIDGEVGTPRTLSWEQILALQAVETDTSIMYCVEGWEVWGVWRGISVSKLISSVSPNPDATHVMFHGIDGYSTALPISYLVKYETLLAYKVNGESLGTNDGYPLRLVAFGLFGYKWAKYVTRMQLINGPKLGFWELYGYNDKAIVALERRKFYEGENALPIEY